MCFNQTRVLHGSGNIPSMMYTILYFTLFHVYQIYFFGQARLPSFIST